MTHFYEMVLVYLKEELSEYFKDDIILEDEAYIITIKDSDDFNTVYNEVYTRIINLIIDIKNRDADLKFIVQQSEKSKVFRIYK